MDGKKKRIYRFLLGSAIVVVCFLIGLRIYVINADKAKEIKLSEQEKEEIQSFYEINPEGIVTGEHFDFKYAYMNPIRLQNKEQIGTGIICIEMEKKDTKPIQLNSMFHRDKNGALWRFMLLPYKRFYTLSEVAKESNTTFVDPLRAEYHQIAVDILVLSTILLEDDNWDKKNETENQYDFSEMHIGLGLRDSVLQFRDQQEYFHLKYDEDKLLHSLREVKEKCKYEQCNRYEKRHIGYYFGTLLHVDFEQWYKEIQEFIALVDVKKERYIISMMYDYEKYDHLDKRKEDLKLTDDQFERYKEIINMIQ